MSAGNPAGRGQSSGPCNTQALALPIPGWRMFHDEEGVEVPLTPEMVKKRKFASDLQLMKKAESCDFFVNYTAEYGVPLNAGGTVLRCKRKEDNKMLAVKIRRWSEECKTEMEAMRGCRGNFHTVKAYAVYSDEMFSYIILELLTGRSLMEQIRVSGNFDEKMARNYIQQLLDALDCIHAHQFVHCALRPENVLLTEDNETLRIIDFAKALRIGSIAGDDMTQYTPPEALDGVQAVDYSLDMWGLGTILYEMFCGVAPFVLPVGHLQIDRTPELIRTGNYERSSPAYRALSQPCKDLIESLLKPKADERPHVRQMVANSWMNAEKAQGKGLHGARGGN